MKFWGHLNSLNQNNNINGVLEKLYYIAGIIVAICTIMPFLKKLYAKLIIKEKELTCVVLSETKISNELSEYNDLNILYKSIQIKRFTITKITFWNNSLTTIYNSNVKEPLSFIVNGGKVLFYQIVGGDKSENGIEIELSGENIVEVTFHLLNHHEGGIIELYHTGVNNSVSITDKIGEIKINTIIGQEENSKWKRLVRVAIFCMIVIVMLVLYCMYIFHVKLLFLIATFIIIFILVYLILSNRRKKKFIPSNCKVSK